MHYQYFYFYTYWNFVLQEDIKLYLILVTFDIFCDIYFFSFAGKGIAALTFDKDYQRKRQEQLNKQPANLQEGLARSGKGLVMVKS